ncbi:hypothetical protein FOT48_02115 [Citrobacter koseri]|nr:hypothetical protein [Citrobacter koseri]MBE0080618.1 hypothetical protein [Citrobacter koseri]
MPDGATLIRPTDGTTPLPDGAYAYQAYRRHRAVGRIRRVRRHPAIKGTAPVTTPRVSGPPCHGAP